MGSFIDALPISEADKRKLKGFGADTPFALLSLIEAAPNEFDSLIGEAASAVRDHLRDLVPQSQKSSVRQGPEFPLGAELGRAPHVQNAPFDTGLRDRLFTEWQKLLKDPATRNSERAKELEEQLNALLKP